MTDQRPNEIRPNEGFWEREAADQPTREEIQRGIRPDTGDQRHARAARFANGILALMQDFLPNNRDYHRLMHRYVFDVALLCNYEIINVPPEWDTLTKIQIEKAMLETHPAFIEHPPGK